MCFCIMFASFLMDFDLHVGVIFHVFCITSSSVDFTCICHYVFKEFYVFFEVFMLISVVLSIKLLNSHVYIYIYIYIIFMSRRMRTTRTNKKMFAHTGKMHANTQKMFATNAPKTLLWLAWLYPSSHVARAWCA